MNEQTEAVVCHHCRHPLRRDQSWMVLYGMCDDCQQHHAIGIVHMDICVLAMAMGEDYRDTQKKRAGMLRMN